MSSEYLQIKANIIEELNKHREIQKELIARKRMLEEFADITTRDYEGIQVRLKETSEKIQTLKDQL